MIDRRTLPLSALRAFECAAVHEHLGRAGDELGVTHGAISHQIKALEERLGVKLFTRTRNRLELTTAGIQLHKAVKEGFDCILDGAHNLEADNLSGNLFIGCTQTIATSWASKHICAFQKKYSTIQVHIKEIEPQQKVIPRDIDIAICYGKPESDGKRVISLASPSLFPVCSPKLIRNRVTAIKPKDIPSYTLLHDRQTSWDKWFQEFNIPVREAAQNIYFPNTSQALDAASMGFGIALGNTFEIQEFIREGKLIRLTEKSIEEENNYYLFNHHDREVSSKSRLFEDWIIQACQDSHL